MNEPPRHTSTHVTLAKGSGTGPNGQQWVQVPRKSMEAMAQLMGESASAAKLLVQITARMGDHNAFVASNQAICDLTGLSLATVKRSLKLLQERKWINILRLGPTGTVRAIVVNDQVAWFGPREGLRHSLFSASVYVSEAEQDALEMRGNGRLHELPAIYRGELQLPTGEGLPPPAQPFLDGMEPELPATRTAPETGEIDVGPLITRAADALRVVETPETVSSERLETGGNP
jgi:hypothetical protein